LSVGKAKQFFSAADYLELDWIRIQMSNPDMVGLGRHIFAYKFLFHQKSGLDTDTVPDLDPDPDPDV
jgi:hypothetical protein